MSSRFFRRCLPIFFLVISATRLWSGLPEYIATPDPSYSWKLLRKSDAIQATLYEIRLTSQTWQGITWQHNLNLFVPTNPPAEVQNSARGAALLMIDGGSLNSLERQPSTNAVLYGATLAHRIGVPCAVLRQVPNQPLLEGLSEDALIAETFRRYLDARDDTWPLLLPMTKAAVRAMDAIGEFSERDLGTRLEKFIVTGASKRGWTTWLTAASDPRVVALAPMVIDVLNARQQMDHQVKVLGTWSDQTGDYHELLRRPESEDIRRLWTMVDPFTFREKITQPKLVILGNNDPYWTTDALNLYWKDLVGPKWIHYVPNAGHNLEPKSVGRRQPPMSAINVLGIFARHQLTGKPMPTLEWKHDEVEGRPRLTVKAEPSPKSARLWIARAPTHDFRAATWEDQPLNVNGQTISAEVPLPSTGSSAFYAALEYEFEGVPFSLCTQLRIVDAPPAAAGR